MNDLIAISAIVADRSYRIKIHPDDEEVVRKTLKTINDKIIEFKTQFAGKDMQDYIAMVLLWFATDQTAKMKSGLEQEDLSGQLDSLEQILDGQVKDKS